MDRRERFKDEEEVLRLVQDSLRASLWTALPGIVQAFNPVAMTAQVQPALTAKYQKPDNTFEEVQLPLLLDCPVIFPNGGGFSLTFPIKLGDECLVVFASRCIDNWWLAGGIQAQAELRFHNLSDGFVIVGPRSQPRVLPTVSTTGAMLRSDDGTAYVELVPNGNGGYLLRFQADDIELSANKSYSTSVHGYGSRLTWIIDNLFKQHNWTDGVVIESVTDEWHPPDIPEGE